MHVNPTNRLPAVNWPTLSMWTQSWTTGIPSKKRTAIINHWTWRSQMGTDPLAKLAFKEWKLTRTMSKVTKGMTDIWQVFGEINTFPLTKHLTDFCKFFVKKDRHLFVVSDHRLHFEAVPCCPGSSNFVGAGRSYFTSLFAQSIFSQEKSKMGM